MPYALNRVIFLRQFYNIAKDRRIENSINDLSEFQTILGPRTIKIFKPTMYQALVDLADNNMAISAGLDLIPPHNYSTNTYQRESAR